MEHVLEFNPELIERAIDAVANASDRHPQWTRRRLNEAIDFVQEHPRTHPDFPAHMALALPVYRAAARIAGKSIGDFRVGGIQ